MCDNKAKVTLRDLIMTAVCYLQEKNFVTLCEIAEYVAKKRGCKVEQIVGMIKVILCKARNMEIICEKKGAYKIMERYDDLPSLDESEESKNTSGIQISEDDSDEEEENSNELCMCLKLSQDCIDDDDTDDDRCPIKQKKRKCG